MYNVINATFKVKLSPINPNAKPWYFYHDTQIDASDEYQLSDMAEDFAKEVLDTLDDKIEDVLEDYSISKDEFNKLSTRERTKFEEFKIDGETRYVLTLELDIDQERESYPQTLSEQYVDIGMSERDFL